MEFEWWQWILLFVGLGLMMIGHVGRAIAAGMRSKRKIRR